jgi:hypothetical protein
MQELPHGLPLTHCGFLVFGVWFVAQTGTQERLTRVTGHGFRPRISVRLPSGPCARLDLAAIRGTV